VLRSLDEYFSDNSNGWSSVARQFAPSALEHSHFWAQTFHSQGSVATHLRVVGYLLLSLSVINKCCNVGTVKSGVGKCSRPINLLYRPSVANTRTIETNNNYYLRWSRRAESVMQRFGVRPSVCSVGRLTMTHQGTACDTASVHFGPTIRRTDILVTLLKLPIKRKLQNILGSHWREAECYTKRYDTIRYSRFTCAQKLTRSMATLIQRTAQKRKIIKKYKLKKLVILVN